MAHLFQEAGRTDVVGIRGTHFIIPIVKERGVDSYAAFLKDPSEEPLILRRKREATEEGFSSLV
ncbi:hypothetical protein TSUD_272560 [Trifolium subterraneum]|uniref:Uncharacterized protein n=1 Tax=Trifolium subterraneum TaxID=3900 RepID=A0A2Z6NZJ2_TRISU|nr:hypothetical protein TSUD_272560 [Trifolium subterraneum]